MNCSEAHVLFKFIDAEVINVSAWLLKMIENIKGIEIKGGRFEESTKFVFFDENVSKTASIAMVYGANGSGKTSVSRAFANVGSQNGKFCGKLLLNGDLSGACDVNKLIFVFNEDFIDRQIRVDSDGVDAVVLLGNQVGVDDEIKEKEKNRNDLERAIEQEEHDLNLYTDFCKTIEKNITDKLKDGLDSWAERSRVIKGNKILSRVDDKVIEAIRRRDPSDTLQVIRGDFERLLDQYEKSSSNSIFDKEIKCLEYEVDETTLEALLLEKLTPPNLLSREGELIKSLIDENICDVDVEKSKHFFENKENHVCPFCFREFEDDYRDRLLRAIRAVLNKEADNHRKSLESYILPDIKLQEKDVRYYQTINPLIIEDLKRLYVEYANEKERCNVLIREKVESIFVPKDPGNICLNASIEKINRILSSLESDRKELEELRKNKEYLKERLLDLNLDMAKREIESLLEDQESKSSSKSEIEERLNNLSSRLNKVIVDIESLKQKKKNTKIAFEKINKDLAYIFCSDKRLTLIPRGDKYVLRSNGRSVRPSEVSVGERNALALSYFFTKIKEYSDVSQLYSQELFLVLDDPVSSFDFDNKFGVLSFFRKEILNMFRAGGACRILFLTHDMQVFSSIHACLCSKDCEGRKLGIYQYELKNGKLHSLAKPNERCKGNEYSRLLDKLYDFAFGSQEEDDELYIGNIARRVLEAFTTFSYCGGYMERGSEGGAFFASMLGDFKEYFDGRLLTLYLNEESHKMNAIKGMWGDNNFFGFLSREQKVNVCKDLLCFIYCLNPYHLKSYLKDVSKIEKTIQEIKKPS